MLTAILDPNRAVEDRYVEYVALTTDGRQLTGILLEETGASLTLAAPEGKRVVAAARRIGAAQKQRQIADAGGD